MGDAAGRSILPAAPGSGGGHVQDAGNMSIGRHHEQGVDSRSSGARIFLDTYSVRALPNTRDLGRERALTLLP